MKVKETTLVFNPGINLCAAEDGSYLLQFDTGAPSDLDRSPILKKINGFRELQIEIEGFDKFQTTDGQVRFHGVFSLKYVDKNGETLKELLANSLLGVHIEKKELESGEFEKIAQRLQMEIRQAVASALSDALARFSDNQQELFFAKIAGVSMAAPALPALPQQGGERLFQRAGAAIMRERKGISWWWIVAIPFAIFFLLWAGGKLTAPKDQGAMSLSNTDAFARQLEQLGRYQVDPAVVTSQVELTKETLRAMGLDTEATSVDMGCLAAPVTPSVKR